ncbi:MAG: ABC transporter ATP-binding protein, partial [Methanomassiliicoccales archaeon]
MSTELVIENLRFNYRISDVLQDISLTLCSSEILGIIGPNGSGKTTLLKCINRILEPKQGKILLNCKDVRKMKRMDVARNFGYVPQKVHAGFDSPTVFEIVLMGRRPHNTWKCCHEDHEEVWNVLTQLNIKDLSMRRFDELSGGQQQKVLIARALAQGAKVLLLDEPTSNLDIKHQLEVMKLIKKLVNQKGISSIVAIHDLNLASQYCNNLIMIKNGGIFAVGDPLSVLTPSNIKEVYG